MRLGCRCGAWGVKMSAFGALSYLVVRLAAATSGASGGGIFNKKKPGVLVASGLLSLWGEGEIQPDKMVTAGRGCGLI